MRAFTVTLRRTEVVRIPVAAYNIDDAIDKAFDLAVTEDIHPSHGLWEVETANEVKPCDPNE